MAKTPKKDPLQDTIAVLRSIATLLEHDTRAVDWTMLSVQLDAIRFFCRESAGIAAQTSAAIAGDTTIPSAESLRHAATFADATLDSVESKDREMCRYNVRLILDQLTGASGTDNGVMAIAKIDRVTVETRQREFNSANILRVTVGTNCPQGGDTGHGGRTILVLEDGGGTDIRVNAGERSVELVFGGDTECETLIDTLEFAAKTLKDMRSRNQA
jgi:hypothetical protein